ncbi:MAG: hypothetical protein QM692_13480 [Thermomicrobiales bacterium]
MYWLVSVEVEAGSGCKDSSRSKRSGQTNPAGSTPTIGTALPSTCTVLPTIAGSPPKCCRHSA